MSNNTTVTDMSMGGALALIVLWVLSAVVPDFVAQMPPGGEAAIALVITGAFSYCKKVDA